MLLVELLDLVGQDWPSLNELFEEIGQEIGRLLLVMPSEIAVDVCEPCCSIFARLPLEMINHDRSEDGLASSRDTGAEERTSTVALPLLELPRREQPLPSPLLPAADEISLLCGVTGLGQPLNNLIAPQLTLLAIQPLDTVSGGERSATAFDGKPGF